MEHLFTSFFRSTAAGSFKEHRMVFQTASPVPDRIENAEQIKQAEAAHEELANGGDIKRATEVRLLLARTAISNPALAPAINDAVGRIDRNTNARNAVPLETTRLEVARGQIATKLNTPTERAAGVDLAVAQIAEARVKLAELGDNARPDSLTSSRVTLSNLYRDQVKAIQDMTTTNKIKTVGTTEVTIAPVLTGPEKDRLTKSFSNENGKTDASRENLGKGYVASEGAVVEGPVANKEFRLNAAPVNGTVKLVGGKWHLTSRVNVGPDPLNAAVASPGAELVATHKYDVTKAPFVGDAPAIANAEKFNRMVDNLIALNLGSATVDVAAGPLGDMINRANAAEVTRAGTDLTALDTDQAAFFAGDFNAGVTRLNAAVTPEAKTAALDSTVAPLGLRVMVKNRRDALWTQLKTISEAPTRPSNYDQQVAKIMDHLAGPVPNGVGARLRAEEVRTGVVAPPAAPTAVEALPDGERKSLEAFNKFLSDNPAVNGLTAVEGTRKPAIDAITTQLSTLNTSPALREQGRAALDAKLATKGYAVDTIAFAPAALTLRTVSATATETLPDAERKSLEAFNKFLADNPAINALTAVEGTRKPAIDAIVAQLGTMNASPALREQGRLVLDAKLRTKGYAVDTIAFAPAALTLRAVPVEAPVTPAESVRLGTDAERKALTDAVNTNRGNLNAPGVRTAMEPFQKQVATLPGPQQAPAVQRLSAELGIRPTATTEGVEFALVGTNIEARTVARLPAGGTAPERKERNDRMSEFIKVIMELLRALLQIEQARSASIDRFLTRSLEQQRKFMNDMQGQMKAIAARPGGTASPEYIRLQGQYKEAQGQIKSLEARVKEMEGRYEAAAKAARNTRTLEVRWSEDDRKASRPPVVCVRRGVTVSAEVNADIAAVRREVPLVATTVSVGVASPTREVPTTAFYVGSINIDNRATTTVNNINSPGSTINAASAATTTVAPAPRVTPVGRTDAPPPPPRVSGTGPRREGSLNG